MMNAIFWGIYPPSEDSPHSLIFKFIGLDTQPNKYIHLLIGTIFYIVAVLISQQQSIMHITTNWWF